MAQGIAYHAAVMVCPPFILVSAVGSASDSTLALVLTGGTIVFANGALYAGLAAFVYWAASDFLAAKRCVGGLLLNRRAVAASYSAACRDPEQNPRNRFRPPYARAKRRQ